jgi:hypothetical protein
VLVPEEAVGPAGVPVKVGLFRSALDEIAEAIALYSVSISVPLIILEGLPEARPSLTAKLVAFT